MGKKELDAGLPGAVKVNKVKSPKQFFLQNSFSNSQI
jgi:hypothetical protein